ncbi:poly(3-hydroxybutyrate) depolymerase [Adhaeribacter arboris]|uniref:Poly(3-hydroxybutyrate) depolymerase n=1 Tax=Adhaeribacter arboris TaxID=2072846 RepID=A0A2T2YDA5_9BACT|nr:alpha/beta hydrolase-fold protein [Adhaeribacter arboris]PSR53428.1 poly(3-hydroxybutyrate) depolymerase [Adhaeribacter arboris]
MKGFCIGLILFLICLLEAKCQVLTDSVLIESHYRTFHFNKPKIKPQNYNLIFVLHGSGGDGKGIMKAAMSLEKQSGPQPIFLVYPDGYKKYWNECRKAATSAANLENMNEQAFFEAMLRYFAHKYGINNQRFFAIGLSGGGHMAFKLALTMPDKCKGISAFVANLPDTPNLDCIESKKPVAVMITNGTQDPINPYQGGPVVVNGSSFGSVHSTNGTFRYWAGLAGYQGEPNVENVPDKNTRNKQSITRFTYQEKNKPEIVLLEVKGGEHTFPADIDGFTESWQFFARQIPSN